MAFTKSTYKLGEMTKSAIDALPTTNLKIGDTVLNTDNKVVEYWNGNVWTNDHCIVVKANETINEYDCIKFVNVSGEARAEQNDSVSTNYNFAGVCARGGGIGDWVVIAIMGRWKVQFGTGNTTRGYFAQSDTLAGEADSFSSASSDDFGIILETVTTGSPRVAWVYISGMEMQ